MLQEQVTPLPAGEREPAVAGKKRALFRLRRSWQLYVLMALPFLYLIIFKYIPMYGAQIAFRDYIVTKGIWGSNWVGLKHFERFVHSYDFWRITKNTLLLSLYNLVASFPFPILLALGLNYMRNGIFKKSVQMVTYAPHFISVVVMIGIVKELLDPRSGIVNQVISWFGFAPIDFLSKPGLFKTIYVTTDIWQHIGFNCIIFIAALSSIDPAQHEAAVMDGASKLQRMFHVDLPGIMPIAVILLILNTGHVLDVGFEKVLLLQNPLNLKTGEIIDTYVYKVGLASQVANYSYSTAINLFKSVINLILLISVNKIAQRTQHGSLW
ncbi:sugar ABC transporter permease [Paenibacillus yonginensis]|uniref:Sugar ABC transporter permease n=2 Tax=Paenibacillus yonginensis TaxID=1462996 RepID=A0A1B1N6F1_9BACL|nr:sugar ABC transporter permease [Paenibacillus yonginensis]